MAVVRPGAAVRRMSTTANGSRAYYRTRRAARDAECRRWIGLGSREGRSGQVWLHAVGESGRATHRGPGTRHRFGRAPWLAVRARMRTASRMTGRPGGFRVGYRCSGDGITLPGTNDSPDEPGGGETPRDRPLPHVNAPQRTWIPGRSRRGPDDATYPAARRPSLAPPGGEPRFRIGSSGLYVQSKRTPELCQGGR